jgi:hypothetical protein
MNWVMLRNPNQIKNREAGSHRSSGPAGDDEPQAVIPAGAMTIPSRAAPGMELEEAFLGVG